MVRYCLDDLTRDCDEVVVLLDNHDKETENEVLKYKEKYGDRFHIFYSGFPGTISKKKGALKRRYKPLRGTLRQRVLDEVKKLHEKKQVDVLVFLDADECFTDYFWQEVEKFWEGHHTMLCIRPIMIFDGMNKIRRRTTIPNGRVYKYRPDMCAIPYRRALYKPFKPENRARAYYITVHLPFLNKESRDFRAEYLGNRIYHEAHNSHMWITEKDVRRYSPKEIMDIVERTPLDFTVGEYLKKTYG